MKTLKENWELFKETAFETEPEGNIMLELELVFVTAFAMGVSESYNNSTYGSYMDDCMKRGEELISELDK